MLFIYLAMIDDDTQRSKFEYIYHTYYGMMYKVAYELTKDQRLAEDAVHETMVNIIEDIDTIRMDNPKELKSYLFACELPAAQASDCQTGLSAVIKQGDQTETAAITAISENAENDTVDITIQLTATDWKVGPADAEIVLSEQDYDLCLPNTAIHQDNQGDFVFAVEEKNTVLGTQNVLVRIPVTVLEVGQSQTSIEGAISPEDSIVVQSTRSLEAGSKVRVKNENA